MNFKVYIFDDDIHCGYYIEEGEEKVFIVIAFGAKKFLSVFLGSKMQKNIILFQRNNRITPLIFNGFMLHNIKYIDNTSPPRTRLGVYNFNFK